MLFYVCEIRVSRQLALGANSTCDRCRRLSARYATLCNQGRAVRVLSICFRRAPRARVASACPGNCPRTLALSVFATPFLLATLLGSRGETTYHELASLESDRPEATLLARVSPGRNVMGPEHYALLAPKGPQHNSPRQSVAAQPRSTAPGNRSHPTFFALKGHKNQSIPNMPLIEFNTVPRDTSGV